MTALPGSKGGYGLKFDIEYRGRRGKLGTDNFGRWYIIAGEGSEADVIASNFKTKSEAAKAFAKLPATREHHATKKSPAQLQREIDEVLARPTIKCPSPEHPLYPELRRVRQVAHDTSWAASQLAQDAERAFRNGDCDEAAKMIEAAKRVIAKERRKKPRQGKSAHATALHDRPMAARGLTSYRIPDRYGGYVMIGAKDHKDAMREARRSTPKPKREELEVWNGEKYVKAHATIRKEDPTYLIVWNYADDGQKFWNGRRWVSDASDATTYPSKKARSAYEQVAGKTGHENISLIEDYGLDSERVAISGY
jgi:hypothetical protein